MTRPTFFIHIPKAAGTSFASFLCSQFTQADVLTGVFWETVRKQPIDLLHRYRLIAGHAGYDLAFHLRNPFVITVLRHPVDRLVSVYEFLREQFERDPDQHHPDPDVNALVQLWKQVVQRPFEAFLESPEPPARAALLDNPQSRQLAQATPYLLTDLTDDVLRQLALSRLATLDVAGCAELFDETVELTCRRQGWAVPHDRAGVRLNVTNQRSMRDTLTPDLRRKIERLSAVDLELHERARARLLDDLRSA